MGNNPFEVIQRGHDSSGRPLKNTALKWQAFDMANGRMGGKLWIVQGAFMGSGGADASAGTHNLAGCNDVRRWNLTAAEAERYINIGDDIGDIIWERTAAQGFDPHFHNLLPNDRPLHPDAAGQILSFRQGKNGLASGGADRRRPNPFPVFHFIKEDDMSQADIDQINRKLDRVLERVNTGFANERERDAAMRQLSKERHRELTKGMARSVDLIGVLDNKLNGEDSASAKDVRRLLRQHKAELLKVLRTDPDTEPTENPSDEAVDEAVSRTE